MLHDRPPIVADFTIANEFGLQEAVVIQQVHYWIQNNAKAGRNFKEGKYWTFNSIKNWQEKEFPYMSYSTVKRIFGKLEKEGVFISGNFNQKGYDKTKWYTINYEVLYSKCCKYSLGQNEPMHWVKMNQSIGSNWTNGMGQNEPTNTREYTETSTDNITTTEVVVSKQKQAIKDILSQKYKDGYTEDFIDRVDKRLSDKKMSIETFKEKVEMSLKDGINNRNGYLLQAIKNDYKEVKTSKKNKFNFDGNIDYSDKELMDKIMKSQERKYGEA